MFLRVISTGSKAGNCYALISDSGEILLLDFGREKKKILRGIDYRILDVVGALLTHGHGDHSKSYKWLLENWISIYTNDETADGFEVVTGELLKGIPEKKWFQCGEFKVMGFYVPHDGCPNYGFLIQHEEIGRLLYMTDMEYCPYSFKNLRVQHLLIEANYIEDLVNREAENYAHQIRGHCSLNTCKGIVEVNKTPDLRTVTLIHLSNNVCDPNRVLKEIQDVAGSRVEVNVAVPGLRVELKRLPF